MKTKKVIRVLEIYLLFKKQDYNHYYLDRHSLQYQYKKEENRRQLRVVIDLHKSHIDFFFGSLVLFFRGFLLEPVSVFTIAFLAKEVSMLVIATIRRLNLHLLIYTFYNARGS